MKKLAITIFVLCCSVQFAMAQVETVTGSRPRWVNNAYSEFNRSQFVAEAGAASTREMAERQALLNIARQFETSVSADQTLASSYQEFVRNNVASWSESTTNQEIIRTSTNIDVLAGAEIRAVWHDTRNNTFHAVAVMEKARVIPVYNGLINANLDIINNLTAMNQQEKNTLEGYSRYWYAGVAADMNRTYVNILTLLGGTPPQGITSGDRHRLEAQNILKNIPIEIVVTNDSDNRIQNAFSKAVSELGFRIGSNSRYRLNVNVIAKPRQSSDGYEHAYMEVSANLIDTQTRATLFPYSFPSALHEGHRTYSQAVNRCYIEAVRLIESGDNTLNPPWLSYSQHFRDYLSRLIPKR